MQMDIAILFSRSLSGIDSPTVTVEVHISRGLPRFTIVGLPETAVKESKDRVRSAILANQFDFPLGRITVNLAPADLPKDGGRFDLAIAVGILAASGQVRASDLHSYEFIGELALTGELRKLKGVLAIASKVNTASRSLVLPQENASEAALIRNLSVLPANHLLDVCAHLNGERMLVPRPQEISSNEIKPGYADLIDVVGQHQARRALEIAAAGRHNLLMIGPPGSGKTMLAERLPGILPPLTEKQALESAAIASISSQGFDPGKWKLRAIRAPHHTASAIALVGGGSQPRPGEISLAHNGVLFLDELPEFQRRVLEVLREPLESGRICISRASNQCEFPADFQLVAAMNPCPCGYFGSTQRSCSCSNESIMRYRNRISGPLLDRIDIHLEVNTLPAHELHRPGQSSEASDIVKERVLRAHNIQQQRSGKPNSKLNRMELEEYCKLEKEHLDLLETAIENLGLSARAAHRTIRLARTIADLEARSAISTIHLSEALNFRQSKFPNIY